MVACRSTPSSSLSAWSRALPTLSLGAKVALLRPRHVVGVAQVAVPRLDPAVVGNQHHSNEDHGVLVGHSQCDLDHTAMPRSPSRPQLSGAVQVAREQPKTRLRVHWKRAVAELTKPC